MSLLSSEISSSRIVKLLVYPFRTYCIHKEPDASKIGDNSLKAKSSQTVHNKLILKRTHIFYFIC